MTKCKVNRGKRTQDYITDYATEEEQNGYMNAVREREPRLERTIYQLAKEHVQLRQSLEALIGESRAAPSLSDTLREEIREWIERVRRHENRENDLIQGAFNLDLGAED
jgi:hemerythrin-like domain-containing protein